MYMLEKTYSTTFGTIHYWTSRVASEAPWLVFLPGLTADHHLFDKQLEVLGEHYNCLVWDVPAHAASRPFQLAFTMMDMADWLYAICALEDITRPFLVGQSMGGYVAQTFIKQWPEAVRGFVSIDSAPLSRSYFTGVELVMLRHTKGMYLSIPWQLLQRIGAKGCAETAYGRTLMKGMIQGYSKQEYCALADYGYRLLADAVVARPDYELHCPMLLLCGVHDQAGSTKRYNHMWAAREGKQLVPVPGAGHNSNTDNPDFVNQEIEGFLRRINGQLS